MATIKSDLLYTKSHEWVSQDGDIYTIGLTDFAQDALGDLVFVSLPEVGDTVEAGNACADAESVKAVSDIFSPLTGTVCEVNDEIVDAPEQINADPYGAWLFKLTDVSSTDQLLDAAAYEEFCAHEEA